MSDSQTIVALNSEPQSPRGLTLPLLLWQVFPLAALAIAAGRVPFWAAFRQPGELLALRLVVAVQVAIAAMCFSLLLSSIQRAIVVIATGWPVALAAGVISATPLTHVLAAEAVVSMFLIVLCAWQWALNSAPLRMLAASISTLWTLGGPILFYWRAESQIIGARDGLPVLPALSEWICGPMVAAIRASEELLFFRDFCRVLLLFLTIALLLRSVYPLTLRARARRNR